MKGLRILSLRWATAAIVAAALVAPQALGAQVPKQGIKVHGHWVIEVRNPNGTLELRREFENALTDGGKEALAQLLSASKTVREWLVEVFSCGPNTGCNLVEPSNAISYPRPTFRNLTLTVVNLNEFILQGSFVASSDASVTEVRTEILYNDGSGTSFTDAFLQSPIPIQATQTVSVTVTFTFS